MYSYLYIKQWMGHLCVAICLVLWAAIPVQAHGNNTATVSEDVFNRYVKGVYEQLDFSHSLPLSFETFKIACRGYLNLRNAGKLQHDRILSIADFSLSSCSTRFWIIDMKERKVLLNDYVAHGMKSGEEFARIFSNRTNSHQTSLGFYVTGHAYNGEHGIALKLHGLDGRFNAAAYDRAIVLHGADYVSKQFITRENRLGRSWGCPAVSRKVAGKVVDMIKDGSCLFLYYPQPQYLVHSVWLKETPALHPDEQFRKRDTLYVTVPSPSQLRKMAMLNPYYTRKLRL